MVDFAIAPDQTALLTIDLQNLFVEGYEGAAPGGLAALERINRLAAVCREANMLVIHARHVLRPDGSNMGILGEMSPAVRSGLLRPGGEPTALHRALVVEQHDLLLDKPRYGAFYGTDLELILRTRHIDTVIIAGIATNICCDTTAREAAVRDLRVLFLSDGTATRGTAGLSSQAMQSATLATLDGTFGQVLSIEQAMRKIAAAGGLASAKECDPEEPPCGH